MRIVLFILCAICFNQIGHAQVSLPKYISNGIVLQRQKPIKFWGYASPGEKVHINFIKSSVTAVTKKDSTWQVTFPAQNAGGPYKLIISASNTIEVEDILIGDVWVCSGQSNMELPMERLKDAYPEVYKKASNNKIRQFTVPKNYDFNKAQQDVSQGNWIDVSPAHIKDFSGVAYFFAQEVYKKEKVPIGIVNTALGGSPAQSWISEQSIIKFPEYHAMLDLYKSAAYRDSIRRYNDQRYKNWYGTLNATDLGLMQQWQLVGKDRSDWSNATMPSLWADFNQNMKPGAVWMHRKFDVNKKQLGKSGRLFLGCIVDADSVYINGKFVGNTTYQYPPRKYVIAADLLVEGKNEITIRVIDENGKGGFVKDKPYEIVLETGDKILLEGEWSYNVGSVMPKIEPHIFIQWKPVGLYNAMINPLFHYPIKGVLWYQGESNTGQPQEYHSLMNTLINDWRKGWKQPDLPFYYVQLANFMEVKDEPQESNWAALRQQQLNMLNINNTAMAVAIDLGEWNDIHPLNKSEVGRRLALHALKNVYKHQEIIASGPLVKRHTVQKNKVIIEFYHTEKGIAKVHELKYFELAGGDRKFVKAKAVVSGKGIVVTSPQIPFPKYVRYAWADNPAEVNFYNTEKLPASPFELKL